MPDGGLPTQRLSAKMIRPVEPRKIMASEPDAPNAAVLLRSTAIFRELSNDQLAEIWSRARFHTLRRSEALVCQGTASDSVYVVVSGRFEVWIEGQKNAVSEIGVGEPIGEIGFFAGTPRTATIIAVRDLVVLELDRASFDAVVHKVPAVYETLLRTLARRLADSSARIASEQRVAAARTIAVIGGGDQPIPEGFYQRLDNTVGKHGKGRLLTSDYIKCHFSGRSPDDQTVSNWLNAIEHEYDLIAYIADNCLTEWTRKAIRQADQVVVVVSGAAAQAPNAVEEFAYANHPPGRRRLVRLHQRRSGWVEGTASWLRAREVAMLHHIAIDDDRDFRSLHRFLTGRALGYVGAGGGGFGPAHLGVCKAFVERGVCFDILGGTSVGAAVLGGLAMLLSPEEVDRRTHDVLPNQPCVQAIDLAAIRPARPCAVRCSTAATVQWDSHRGRVAALFRSGDCSRWPGRRSLSHSSRSVLASGARVGLAPGGAAAGIHRRRPHARGRWGHREHSVAFNEDRQDRTESCRALRLARGAAFPGGVCKHSRPLAARSPTAHSGRTVSPSERGIVWELSLSLLPKHARLLLLSATVGNSVEFLNWLQALPPTQTGARRGQGTQGAADVRVDC